MKTNVIKSTIVMLSLLLGVVGCDKDNEMNNNEISLEEFCACIDLENIDKTIPVVNEYLRNIGKSLDNEHRAQALVGWFKSHSCIVDARIILHEISGYQPKRDVAFSFMDGEIVRELILNFSTTNKVLSYHYDLYHGIFVKTNKDFTINKVFDLINSLDLDAEFINYGVYVSTMLPDKLQYVLDNLNAKPYTGDSNTWRQVTGYLHFSTNQITIFPPLFNMNNKDYQADWLQTMKDYELVEHFIHDHSGYVIEFLFPETLDKYWKTKFDEYEFVEWAELNYNKYFIFDKSI